MWVDTKTRLMPYSLVTKQGKKKEKGMHKKPLPTINNLWTAASQEVIFLGPLNTFYLNDAKRMRVRWCATCNLKRHPRDALAGRTFLPARLRANWVEGEAAVKICFECAAHCFITSDKWRQHYACSMAAPHLFTAALTLWVPLWITGVPPTPTGGRHGNYFPSSCDLLD